MFLAWDEPPPPPFPLALPTPLTALTAGLLFLSVVGFLIVVQHSRCLFFFPSVATLTFVGHYRSLCLWLYFVDECVMSVVALSPNYGFVLVLLGVPQPQTPNKPPTDCYPAREPLPCHVCTGFLVDV